MKWSPRKIRSCIRILSCGSIQCWPSKIRSCIWSLGSFHKPHGHNFDSIKFSFLTNSKTFFATFHSILATFGHFFNKLLSRSFMTATLSCGCSVV